MLGAVSVCLITAKQSKPVKDNKYNQIEVKSACEIQR